MNNDLIPDAAAAHELLSALEQQLGAADQSYDLVVVGGAALLAPASSYATLKPWSLSQMS